MKGFTVDAIGFPKFTMGERVLLFLEPDSEADRLRVTVTSTACIASSGDPTAARPRCRLTAAGPGVRRGS